MRWLDRLRAPLPDLPDTDAEAMVLARVERMAAATDLPDATRELREMVENDLFSFAANFRDKLPMPDEELAMELYLYVGVGALLGAQDAGCTGEQAVESWQDIAVELREYVAYGQRERFDLGPVPLLNTAEKISPEADPAKVCLGMLPMRNGLSYRRGASAGLIRLAALSQLGGHGLGQHWNRARGQDA
ncbi:MAG: hypothetical protein ACI9VR_002034 [Cognaticolwellia sp.]|jgi:hypothetical protein